MFKLIYDAGGKLSRLYVSFGFDRNLRSFDNNDSRKPRAFIRDVDERVPLIAFLIPGLTSL